MKSTVLQRSNTILLLRSNSQKSRKKSLRKQELLQIFRRTGRGGQSPEVKKSKLKCRLTPVGMNGLSALKHEQRERLLSYVVSPLASRFFVFTFRSNVKKRGCFQKDTLCWQPFSVMQDPLAGSGALKGTVDKAAHMAGYCAKADNRPANIRAAAKPRVMPVCACPKHPNGFDKAGFRRRAPAGCCDPAFFRGR